MKKLVLITLTAAILAATASAEICKVKQENFNGYIYTTLCIDNYEWLRANGLRQKFKLKGLKNVPVSCRCESEIVKESKGWF